MFTLKLYDRNHKPLNLGDIVKISDRRQFQFFAEVTWLKKEKALAPFHTFSFHSFEKVDKVPKKAIKSTEERYNIWYLEMPEEDIKGEQFEKYLSSWRECETLINEGCFSIGLLKG